MSSVITFAVGVHLAFGTGGGGEGIILDPAVKFGKAIAHPRRMVAFADLMWTMQQVLTHAHRS